jgi:anti-sigma-K factor RskA
MKHEDYKALLPLEALSTLDGDEERVLGRHLATCAECRAELDDWRAATGALAHTADQIEPSAGVRDRILAAARAEPANARLSPNVDKVVPISRPSIHARQPSTRSWGFPAIAAAVIFVGLIIGLLVLWRQNLATRAEVARLTEQMKQASGQLDQKQKILQLLTTPGARMASLAGTKEAPSAHGMLAVDSKSGRAVFMAQGLPQAPAGKAYQLWFIADKHPPMPGKVFKTDAAGEAMMDEQLPVEALAAGTFAVTLEPQDGVRAPTGPMYLLTKTS